MAISGLQVINIGLQNESTGSDSLYTAFNKTKTNFATLFANSSPFNTFNGNAGISVDANSNTGIVSITNTGVTSLIAGTGISIDQSTGNITISSTGGGGNGGGTVTSVGVQPVSNTRITVLGSPIVSAGNMLIDLATTGITPGTYSIPSMNVDAYGRITAIANGTSAGTVTSVAVSPGFGIQVTGSPITTSGTITIQNTGVTRLSAGSGISLSGSNGNVTISTIPLSGIVTSVDIASNTLSVTGSPITTAGTIYVELPSTGNSTLGNLTVNGNLSVLGNITYINTEVLSIEDPVIQIGTGPNGAAPTSNSGKDVGTALNYYDSVAKIAWMGWDVSNVEISFGSNVSFTNEVATIHTLANIRAGNAILGNSVTSNYFVGNVNGGLFQNGSSNVTIASGGNVSVFVAGNATARAIFTSTGANIAGTANVNGNISIVNNANIGGTANVIGNASVGNLDTTTAVITTGNITTINSGLLQNGTSNVTLTGSGNVSVFVAGNSTARAIFTSTGANIAGTANISNLETSTGNITTLNSGLLQNGTSNITLNGSGNISVFVAGNATARTTFTSTGANIEGTANVTGNANVGNLGTSTAVITTGNITTINSGLIQNSTSNVTLASGGNVSIFVAGNATARAIFTSTGANIAGNANIGNIETTTAVVTTGNITTINSGLLQNGTSNVTLTSGGNVSVFVAGNSTARAIFTSTGANIAGNANVGNLSTTTATVTTGNITTVNGGSLYANSAIGYVSAAGGTIAQSGSRTSSVNIDKICGAITLFSAAGSATYQTFTVTNNTVAATDVIIVNQKSGTDKYIILVTAVAAGSFNITFATTGGTTTEQPVFNFAVIKAVTA